MKQIPIKLGPLTLLLTVITICLTVLSILTFTTARADMSLARRYADTVKTRYELEARGQEFLAESAGTLSGVTEKTFELNDSYLNIELDGSKIIIWQHGRNWEEDTEMNVWDGN